ncbi:cell wall-binding repeat-containing protein [Candidatus Poriferisodalis sp.]|uniref:cell wall-binding repeat-containing protein n=1 Tax=Candidatus Poriferisodalis sp. TaxID=3101277 RepID=UPI003AF4128E
MASALSARTPGSAVAYTESGALPDATRRLLHDYRPAQVLVVGGEAAIEPAVVSGIRAAVPAATVERVSGATRTATAAQVAQRFLGPHQAAATDELTVIVANGWSPPDIGVAAAVSARTAGSVVLYTEAGQLSAEAAEALRDYQPARIVFIGGTTAITAEVKDQASAIVPAATTPRYSGSTRTHTAATVARRTLGPR